MTLTDPDQHLGLDEWQRCYFHRIKGLLKVTLEYALNQADPHMSNHSSLVPVALGRPITDKDFMTPYLATFLNR